jgi:hypothetical protein
MPGIKDEIDVAPRAITLVSWQIGFANVATRLLCSASPNVDASVVLVCDALNFCRLFRRKRFRTDDTRRLGGRKWPCACLGRRKSRLRCRLRRWSWLRCGFRSVSLARRFCASRGLAGASSWNLRPGTRRINPRLSFFTLRGLDLGHLVHELFKHYKPGFLDGSALNSQ